MTTFNHCPADVPDEHGVSGCAGCDGSGRGDCEAVFDLGTVEAIKDAGGAAFLDVPETPQAYAKRKSAEDDRRALELQMRHNDIQNQINRR